MTRDTRNRHARTGATALAGLFALGLAGAVLAAPTTPLGRAVAGAGGDEQAQNAADAAWDLGTAYVNKGNSGTNPFAAFTTVIANAHTLVCDATVIRGWKIRREIRREASRAEQQGDGNRATQLWKLVDTVSEVQAQVIELCGKLADQPSGAASTGSTSPPTPPAPNPPPSAGTDDKPFGEWQAVSDACAEACEDSWKTFSHLRKRGASLTERQSAAKAAVARASNAVGRRNAAAALARLEDTIAFNDKETIKAWTAYLQCQQLCWKTLSTTGAAGGSCAALAGGIVHPGDSLRTDIDGDGEQDVVQLSGSGDRIGVSFGMGGLELSATETFALGDAVRSIAITDTDGDCEADVVGAYGPGETRSVWHGLGDGRFDELPGDLVPSPAIDLDAVVQRSAGQAGRAQPSRALTQ